VFRIKVNVPDARSFFAKAVEVVSNDMRLIQSTWVSTNHHIHDVQEVKDFIRDNAPPKPKTKTAKKV
jgi:hypothetical protein